MAKINIIKGLQHPQISLGLIDSENLLDSNEVGDHRVDALAQAFKEGGWDAFSRVVEALHENQKDDNKTRHPDEH